MRVKLGEYIVSYGDGLHGTPNYDENGTHHFVNGNNIFSDGLHFDSNTKKISYEEYLKYKKDLSNALLVSINGSIGNVCLYNNEPIMLGKSIGYFTFSQDVNIKYVKYVMELSSFKEWLLKIASGSTIKNIAPKQVLDFQFDLPDRKTQDKIVEILSGIDEQIERNNEFIKRLQVLAQTTYSRWFNQFEFPNEHGMPYKSSGGKMVWNDELKREIPEDWSVKTLSDLLIKNTEKLQDYNGIPTIDLSVMKSNNIALGELNTSNNFSTNLFVMHKGDLMFGSIRPYLHKAGIAPCDGAFAGTVHSYRPIDDIDYNICLSALTNNDIFSFAVKNAQGTKMPVIASDDLLQYKIPYNESVSKQFTKLLDVKNIICNCMMQNNMLIQLQNNILPLLINGQLSI